MRRRCSRRSIDTLRHRESWVRTGPCHGTRRPATPGSLLSQPPAQSHLEGLRVRPLTVEEGNAGLTSMCEVDEDDVSVTLHPPDSAQLHAAMTVAAAREKATPSKDMA